MSAPRARKLTRLESSIKRRYTRLVRRNLAGGLPEYHVELVIDSTCFHLEPWFEDKLLAEWQRDLLAIHLAEIVNQNR